MNQRDLIELHSNFLRMGWQIKADLGIYGYAYSFEKGESSASITPYEDGFRVSTVGSSGEARDFKEPAENLAWLEIERFIDSESKSI